MNESFKKTFLFILLLVVLLVFYQIFESLRESDYVDEGFSILPGEQARAVVGKRRIVLNVADTIEERMQGLSGVSSLPQGRGLLFIFDNPGRHGIWMKDMNFSIDVLWINENRKVVHIEESLSPDTYPKVFIPSQDASYVIETNAGFLQDAGVSVGDSIVIEGI